MNFRIFLHGFQYFAGLIGGSLECGAREVAFAGKARQTGDDTACISAPIGGVKSAEGWYEIDAAIVANGAGERFDVATFLHQAAIVAHPLDQGTGDGDAAFESVDGRLRSEVVADCSE